jgi:peptidoglycan hydrolase-like protein with peptidoglycan-binding domain
MQEAQAQMQEFEKEMASMPPDQRRMMENMMGPRLEMMRNMVSGGGFRSEITVNEIAVNPVMTGADGEPCPAGGAEPTGDARPAPPPAPQAAGASGSADNLNVMVQEHLQTLGYYSGEAHGNLDTATIVAISRFQSENDMDVTGEVTPQLAGILAARASRGNAAAAQAAAAPDPAALQRAQEACLQEKIEKAQASQKKKRGFGRLLSGVSRAATQFGGSGIATDLSRTTSDLYAANATAEDLSAAASDLGLTEDDIEACRNPM